MKCHGVRLQVHAHGQTDLKHGGHGQVGILRVALVSDGAEELWPLPVVSRCLSGVDSPGVALRNIFGPALFQFVLELQSFDRLVERFLGPVEIRSLHILPSAGHIVRANKVGHVVHTVLLHFANFERLIFAVLLNPRLDFLPVTGLAVSTITTTRS